MKEKPKYSLCQNMAYLLKICRKVSKGLLLSTLLLSLLELSENLIRIYLAPVILDKVESGAPLSQMLLTIALFTLALAACTTSSQWIRECTSVFESRLFDHFFASQFLKNTTTSYPNTLDTDFLKMQNQAIENMSGNSSGTPPVALINEAGKLLTALLGFVAYLIVLTDLDPLLLLATIATSAIGFYVNRRINQFWDAKFEQSQHLSSEIMYPINTVLSNKMAKDIRIFHMQDWLLRVLDKSMSLLGSFYSRREAHLFIGKAVDIVLAIGRNALAYVYLLRMVLDGGMSASEFLLHFSAITGFTGWVTMILNSIMSMHMRSRYFCHIRQLLQWDEPFRFEGAPKVPRSEDGKYELRLEDVSYRYCGSERDTITHMNLTIRPGEKLAIVGLNGAGKSTLVKLLCGLLDPSEGRVTLNGEDIRRYDRRDYYALFTAVFQDFSLLQTTLAANIAQSETQIDIDRVQDCVNRAGISEMIQKLPQGLQTNLGKIMNDDGLELSGGQEQRLMLARALYKNAPILVLDEPTAALDPIAENDMYMRYNDIVRGQTAIYISHRLASTRFCDRVLFLKDGVIAEEGTHEALLALGGGYAELFEIQSRYYREGDAEHEA